jgi:hypothetical protein
LQLLQEYVSSLDGTDRESTFLKLWAILEKLTACGDDGVHRYDLLVDRGSFIWRERQEARVLLEHLRQVRNDVVHHLRSPEEANTCVFQLLGFVHALLWFHLQAAGEFASLSEAGQFLHLSKDRGSLQKQIRIRQLALKHFAKDVAADLPAAT